MPMVAKQNQYTLFVVDDEDAQSPRDDRDNFGTMACWHRRYNLGEKHNYSDSAELFRELIDGKLPAQEVIDYVLNGKSENLRLEFDESENEWNLKSYFAFHKEWHTIDLFYESIEGQEEEICECILAEMEGDDLKEFVERYNVILPLYLYDHSGITINIAPFSCRWDSGQVGWIYASHDKIREEYGDTSPENLEKAENLLRSEVEEYDYYLTGQSYGFKLFNGQNEVDSCWGFLGQISDVSKAIKEYLPDDCKDIVTALQYQSESIDEDEYLEQENEDECEI